LIAASVPLEFVHTSTTPRYGAPSMSTMPSLDSSTTGLPTTRDSSPYVTSTCDSPLTTVFVCQKPSVGRPAAPSAATNASRSAAVSPTGSEPNSTRVQVPMSSVSVSNPAACPRATRSAIAAALPLHVTWNHRRVRTSPAARSRTVAASPLPPSSVAPLALSRTTQSPAAPISTLVADGTTPMRMYPGGVACREVSWSSIAGDSPDGRASGWRGSVPEHAVRETVRATARQQQVRSVLPIGHLSLGG